MKRDAQSVLLILVGGAILRISVSDIYLRYVKEGLRPFLLAAGTALLVLGVVSALRDGLLRNSPPRAHAADGDDGHGHSHGHGPAVAWLLCLPVFAIFLIAPPALGSYAASRDAGTVAKPTGDSDYPPLPPGDPVVMPVTEYAVRAIWDRGKTLEGRTVALTGFVTPRKEGGWYLTRMVLNCCAADARAFKIDVRGAGPMPADTWVEVTGTWVDTGTPSAENAIPALQSQNVKQVPAPRDPYG